MVSVSSRMGDLNVSTRDENMASDKSMVSETVIDPLTVRAKELRRGWRGVGEVGDRPRPMNTPTRMMFDPKQVPDTRRRLHLREITDTGSAVPETVGGELRAARLAAGHDLRDVSDALRIRYRHLDALERGDHGNLPGKTYAVGFVRAYAEHLGLNPDDLVRRFKSELGEPVAVPRTQSRQADLGFPDASEEPRLPTGITMILVLILMIGGGVGWYLSRSPGLPVEETVQSAPAYVEPDTRLLRPPPSVPLAENSLAENTQNLGLTAGGLTAGQSLTGEGNTGEGGSGQPFVETVAPVLEGTPGPDAAPGAVSDPGGSDQAVSDPAVSDPSGVEGANGAGSALLRQTVANETAQLELPGLPQSQDARTGAMESRVGVMAVENKAWLRIDDGNGRVIVQRELREGELYTVPDLPGLILSAKNGGALVLIVDGRRVGPVGRNGELIRGITLDPYDLKRRETGRTDPSR